MKLKVYENYIWNLLDDGSKLYIIELLIDSGFSGNVKVIAVPKIQSDNTITLGMHISDENGNELNLPINILDILNN